MIRQVLVISVLCFDYVIGHVSYSIPEEMAKGSLVGNIVQDLGLDLKRVKSGKARLYTGDSAQFIELNKERGVLLIKEKIDREALCRQTTPCALHFQITLENPLELFPSDGSKKVEMILQKPLDREKQEHISLILTAEDGGEPQMTGTMQIHVTVLDANDNAPVFSQAIYKAAITENSEKGTLVIKVTASDADSGQNGNVTYVVGNSMDPVSKLFRITRNGEVILDGPVDYEKEKIFNLDIEAIDQGGLSDS
ncbi:hypothetical protein CCH79_00021016, partial [Gambusia affinis]